MKIGILPLARPTFDVPYARERLSRMLHALEETGHEIVGNRDLLLDDEAAKAAVGTLANGRAERVVILQVTFTDASMTTEAALRIGRPISICAIPEPRVGGRLRLNSFCVLNLASHALSLKDRPFSWLYADPLGLNGKLEELLEGRQECGKALPGPVPTPSPDGEQIVNAICGRRIGVIGRHPDGFDTCAYDPETLETLAGVQVDRMELQDLFSAARAVPADAVAALKMRVEARIEGVEKVDASQLDRSLRLRLGLDDLRAQRGADAFAIRCWPEMFTQYGGAVCGPAAMMGENGTPCACEADVMGALTQMILQEAAGTPVFLADLVDMDIADDTGVVWHCGQAPISMRDPDAPATATVHTNRRQPLLYQFPLKPGQVTFLRISQSFNRPKMVLSHGRILARPMAYTGTSGVVRFERPAREVLDGIIGSGLEHHMALAYGDFREVLRGVAGAMNLPLLEI